MKYALLPKYRPNRVTLEMNYKLHLGYRLPSPNLNRVSISDWVDGHRLTKFRNKFSLRAYNGFPATVRVRFVKFSLDNNPRFWKFYLKYWSRSFFINKLKFKHYKYRSFSIHKRLRYFLWRIRKLRRILSWAKFCVGVQNDPELLKSLVRRQKRVKLDKYTKYLNYLNQKFGGKNTTRSSKPWQASERKLTTNNLLSLRPKLLLPGFKRKSFQKPRLKFRGVNSYKGKFLRTLQLQISLGLIKLTFLRKYVKLYAHNLNKSNRFAYFINFRLFVFLYNLNLCQNIVSSFYIIRLFGLNINFTWVFHPTALINPGDIFYLPLVLRYYLSRTYIWKRRRIFKFFFKNLPYNLILNFRSGAFLLQIYDYNYDAIKFGKKFYKVRFNGFGKEKQMDFINANTYMHSIKYFNRR